MPFYLKHTGFGEVRICHDELPRPGKGELLVKVESVAQNPADPVDNEVAPHLGATVGYEFAGVVAEIGDGVTKFKLGDRVSCFAFGNCSFNHSYGAFGEYALGFEHTTFHIPEDYSYDEAVTLPAALMVAVQVLYQNLKLPSPSSGIKSARPLLIYGAGTAIGSMLIQFAKLSGCSPILTTSSPKHFDFLKSLGADECFDYRDPDVAAKVQEFAGGQLDQAVDAASMGDSTTQAAKCLTQGMLVCLNVPNKKLQRQYPSIQIMFTATLTSLGYAFKAWNYGYAEKPADKAFMEQFWGDEIQKLIDEKKILPREYKVMPGGLSGVVDGWKLSQSGQASGVKLVYHVGETQVARTPSWSE